MRWFLILMVFNMMTGTMESSHKFVFEEYNTCTNFQKNLHRNSVNDETLFVGACIDTQKVKK